MKVKCRNCGKRFDYDLYTGLCPKCSTYYQPDVSMSDTSEVNASKPNTSMSGTSQPTSKTKKDKGFLSNKKITIFLVLIIITILVIPVLMASYQIRQREQELTLESLQIPASANVSEPISISTSMGTYLLTITGISEEPDSCYDTPEGYQVIAIYYTITPPANEPQSSIDDNYILSSDWSYRSLAAYLHTKSGQYLQAVSEYDIARANGDKDYDWRKENGIGSYFQYYNGSIYYLVKENDIAGLLINHKNPDTDQLIESYYINSLEVSR